MEFNILKRKITYCYLFLFLSINLFSQIDPDKHLKRLWNEFNSSKIDSIKISRLFDIALFHHDYLEQDAFADSISQIAIQMAQLRHEPKVLIYAYQKYIESNNLYRYNQKALNYALISESLAQGTDDPILVFKSYSALTEVYLAGYEYDKALEYSYKSLSSIATSENTNFKVESFLNIGKSLDGKNQKIEAFRNYLNALSLSEKLKDKRLQIACCEQLAKFYNLNKLYVKSVQYKLKQQDLIKSIIPIDSVALMWTEHELQEIDLNSNHDQLNEKSLNEILDFATRWKNTRLLNVEIALIRKHFIESDKIGLLRDLYYIKYPYLFNNMESKNPGLYYRLKAYFSEFENKPDSALSYFNKAEAIFQSEPNKILLSNFYYRYGQFLKRHDLKVLAIDKFSKSYDLAKEASYFDYMINSSKQLESLYAEKNDYKTAYTYSLLNIMLTDSLNSLSKKDQMLAMEIDHETVQRNLAAEQERQATIRRYSLQYTGMIILMIIIFIILLMLGSLRVPVWIIKMLGFFAFIFFFEFIVLLADHKIHHLTGGEPWKIMLIKIFLIAILLPIHHFVEKRVVSFLINPNMINIFHYPFRTKVKEQIIKMMGKEKLN